jgi:Tfp pilus assembly protein PilF
MVNFNIALLEAEFGNLDACETRLRVALKAAPEMAQAAYNLGILLRQKKDDEGFKWLKTAVELSPDNWNYMAGYIAFLREAGRSGEIEHALKTAVASGHAAATTYLTLAGNYQRENRLAEAAEIYKKAMLDKQLNMETKRFAARMEKQLRAAQQP